MTAFNKGDVLVNYALKSILEQTYKNLQIIVIADHSTDDTDKLMSKIIDTRVIYKNLESQSLYPGRNKTDVWWLLVLFHIILDWVCV